LLVFVTQVSPSAPKVPKHQATSQTLFLDLFESRQGSRLDNLPNMVGHAVANTRKCCQVFALVEELGDEL
jgi:hypothetical protein